MYAGYEYRWNGTEAESFTAYGAAYAVSFVFAGEHFGDGSLLRDRVYRMEVVQAAPGPYGVPDPLIGVTVADIL